MPRTEALPLVINFQAAVFRPHQQLDLPITPPVFSPCRGNMLQIISSAYLFVSKLQALSCGLALDDTACHEPGVIRNPSFDCTVVYNCGDNTRDLSSPHLTNAREPNTVRVLVFQN